MKTIVILLVVSLFLGITGMIFTKIGEKQLKKDKTEVQKTKKTTKK